MLNRKDVRLSENLRSAIHCTLTRTWTVGFGRINSDPSTFSSANGTGLLCNFKGELQHTCLVTSAHKVQQWAQNSVKKAAVMFDSQMGARA